MLSNFISFAISLIFVVFILSAVATSIQEFIANRKNRRGRFLKEQLERILWHNNTLHLDFTQLLFNHPLINQLKERPNKYPAYIDSKTFATVIIDVIGEQSVKHIVNRSNSGLNIEFIPVDFEPDAIKRFKKGVESLPDSELKRGLTVIIENAVKTNDDGETILTLESVKQQLIYWFDEQMGRAGGWYKTKMQKRLFITGIILAVALNADFIQIAKILWRDGHLRNSVSEAATLYYNNTADSIIVTQTKIDTIADGKINPTVIVTDTVVKKVPRENPTLKEYNSLNIPIGWEFSMLRDGEETNNVWRIIKRALRCIRHADVGELYLKKVNNESRSGISYWLLKFAGWLIMGFLIRNGSPFWFELLGKVVNLRSTGFKPTFKPDENTETKTK